MTVPIYWDMTPRYSINGSRRFETHCLIFQGRNVQEMDHLSFLNVSNRWPNDAASYFGRTEIAGPVVEN